MSLQATKPWEGIGGSNINPAIWWHRFCNATLSTSSNALIFEELGRAIELFPTDVYRGDVHLLNIWIAYLELHFELNEDVHEVRRLYKFLKSEHVGSSHPDLYLYWAKFEAMQGKVEKAVAVLEGGLTTTALGKNEKLQLALLQLQTNQNIPLPSMIQLGKAPKKDSNLFENLDPISLPTPTTQSLREDASKLQAFNPYYVTPEVQAAYRRESLLSTASSNIQRLPNSHSIDEFRQPLPLSKSSTRLKKVGLGPPQREIISTAPSSPTSNRKESSPRSRSNLNDDSTVPRNSISPLPITRKPFSPLSKNYHRQSITELDSLIIQSKAISPLNRKTNSFTIRQYNEAMEKTAENEATKEREVRELREEGELREEREEIEERRVMKEIEQREERKENGEGKERETSEEIEEIEEKENMSLTAVNIDNIQKFLSTTRPDSKLEDEPQVIRKAKISGRTYRILHLIGRGGSSKVFKVLAPDNHVLAFKKVSLRNLDDTTLGGYVNEISLLRRFSNDDHIIKLLDAEINRDKGYLNMLLEYGEADLGKLLRQREGRPIDYNFIRYSWQQMLVAVKTVHRAKIVHCDLKPANFLLVQGILKLIDFGISKAITNDTTNIVRENQMGTLNYMSPEALQESNASEKGLIKIGRSSDVWSLGCILYEMTYGKPPFAKFSMVQRLTKIMDYSYQIDFPRIDNPALVETLRSCLQREAKQRPTIDDLLNQPFLVPHKAVPLGPKSSNLETDQVAMVKKDQIKELLQKFAQIHPEIDPQRLTELIFQQWSQANPL